MRKAGREGGDAVIRLENIVKSYSQADLTVEVLKGFPWRLPRGSSLLFWGPPARASRPSMHILGLLDRATSGRYVLQGPDIVGLSDDG